MEVFVQKKALSNLMRSERRISYRAMFQVTGISDSTLWRVENGYKGPITVEVAIKIALFFGFEPLAFVEIIQ